MHNGKITQRVVACAFLLSSPIIFSSIGTQSIPPPPPKNPLTIPISAPQSMRINICFFENWFFIKILLHNCQKIFANIDDMLYTNWVNYLNKQKGVI